MASGAHRRDRDGNGRYEHAEAIRILDGFWPRWMRAQFEASLGAPLFEALRNAHEFDNAPNDHGSHVGSAYQTGWYGYAYKDLRRVLGLRVKQPYSKRYCGGGNLARCRSALLGALGEAIDADPGGCTPTRPAHRRASAATRPASTRSPSARRAPSLSR